MIEQGVAKTILNNISERLSLVIEKANINPQVVDVGSRGGMSIIPPQLARNFHMIGFEPNPKEYEKLILSQDKKIGKSGFKKETYFDIALWSEKGVRDFFETIAPGACTFMGESNRKSAENIYLDFSNNDKRKSQNFYDTHTRVLKTHKLKVDKLDSIIDASNYIDLLKVDVEGAELEVFKGAQELFKQKKILFIYSEFMTVPYYDNHALLCDQYQFLRDNGFRLINMDLSHATYKRRPSDLPTHLDNPLLHSGDAYYILDPDLNDLSKEELFRASIQCFIFGFNSLGLTLLEESHFVDDTTLIFISEGINRIDFISWVKLNWKSLPETKFKESVRSFFRLITFSSLRKT